MRLGITLITLICAFTLNTVDARAQGRGNGRARQQPVQTRGKVETPKSANTARTKTQPARRAVKTDARSTKTEARRSKADARSASKTRTRLAAAEITPATPVSQPVKNPKLEARLQRMLPADLNVQDARTGFKNWGQFVAAVHVSNNLGIPFADLKAKMTGITPGTDVRNTPMSLGQAIQDLRGATAAPGDGPTRHQSLTSTRIKSEVKKAEDAANNDLRQTRDRS